MMKLKEKPYMRDPERIKSLMEAFQRFIMLMKFFPLFCDSLFSASALPASFRT